jgi:predicted secreted protein
MSLTSALAIYFIIWWMVLFAVLPWGADSAHERGEEVEAGMAPSAPLNPHLKRKFAVTTVIALVVFAVVYGLMVQERFGLDDIPFLPGRDLRH